MKKYLKYIIMAIFTGMLSLSIQAEAATAEAIQIEASGAVTIISPQAAGDDASSLQLSLEVNSADAANIEFRFRESSAKVQEFRYDQSTNQLNIYIAGTEPLFADNADTFTLGTIAVLDGNGSNAAATVSVVADSFAYVYGTELKTVEDMTLPGNVQLNSSLQPLPVDTPAPTPQPTQKPASSDNSQGDNNNSQGNNNSSQGNNNNSQGTNNSSQGSNNNPQGNNSNSQGTNNNLLGTNNGSQGTGNNLRGNNGDSKETGGASQEKPDSSQEDNSDLKGDETGSQSSGDAKADNVPTPDSENEDDGLSPVWNSFGEDEAPTQKNPETAKETNWILTLVIIVALLIVAAIAAGAVVLYKKQRTLDARK